MKKRILSFVLALVMAVSLLPVSVLATAIPLHSIAKMNIVETIENIE